MSEAREKREALFGTQLKLLLFHMSTSVSAKGYHMEEVKSEETPTFYCYNLHCWMNELLHHIIIVCHPIMQLYHLHPINNYSINRSIKQSIKETFDNFPIHYKDNINLRLQYVSSAIKMKISIPIILMITTNQHTNLSTNQRSIEYRSVPKSKLEMSHLLLAALRNDCGQH
jgi:hypothetical protein